MDSPLRTRLNDSLKAAMKDQDKRALSTVRLILAAVKDRDIAARGKGNTEGLSDEEILGVLQTMIRQRQEAAEFYTQFSQANPAVAAVAGDLIVKAQDYPMSDAIAERLRLTLPPPIQQALSQQGQQSPDVQAAMMQVQAMEQQLQQQAALVQ